LDKEAAMAKSAKPPRLDAQRLAESLMPGWKAVETYSGEGAVAMAALPDSMPDGVVADSAMPSMEKLKAKYGVTDPTASADAAGSESDTVIVKLQNGPLRKTVAVSPSAQKVIWSQG